MGACCTTLGASAANSLQAAAASLLQPVLAGHPTLKMEFDMLPFTKEVPIVFALTLGISLGGPLSVAAFADSAQPSAIRPLRRYGLAI